MSLEKVRVEVEKGAIRKFVQAIGDDNPLFIDEAFARECGYQSVIAPPTFPATFEVPMPDLNIELSRSLHGGQEYSYTRPIVAGDVLVCEAKLTASFERTGSKGNKMTFYIVESTGNDLNGDLVYTSKTTIIFQ